MDQIKMIYSGLLRPLQWERQANIPLLIADLSWALHRLSIIGGRLFVVYALKVFVPTFHVTSIFGFALLINILTQLWSGILLALAYLPDPSFVIPSRSDFYAEIWWFNYAHVVHVVGVDLLFTLSYLHILKKVYIRNYVEGNPDGWYTGMHAFLIFHLVVFLGITLGATHLSDVTVMIAGNMFWSLVGTWHRAFTIIFGNRHLTQEQLERYAMAHYASAWYYIYLVQTHVVFVHELWEAGSELSTQQQNQTPKASWVWDALKKELLTMFAAYKGGMIVFLLIGHPDTRILNFNFFEQWGEAEFVDINYYIVSPHWYFRAHMGLLTLCARHYEGLSWLIAFYVGLCALPAIARIWAGGSACVVPKHLRRSLPQEVSYVLFWGSLAFVGATLPCGRFYYDLNEGFVGQSVLRFSYQYLYAYLFIIPHLIARFEHRFVNELHEIRHIYYLPAVA